MRENIYYSPETWGLTAVDSIDFADSYEFDIYAVWISKDGVLYWGSDSGCSCPTPFEDVHSLTDLQRIDSRGGYDALHDEVAGRVFDRGHSDEAHQFLDKVLRVWQDALVMRQTKRITAEAE